MRMHHEFRWDDFDKLQFDLEHILPRRQTGTVRHPEYMSVDRHGRLAERHVEHDIRGLAADARQRLQHLAHAGYLAAMLGDQLLRQCDDVLRLVAIEPDGLDEVAHLRFAERDHLLRRIGRREQGRRRLVDTGIGCLRRQHHGNQERERIDVLQFALGRRVDRLEAPERLRHLGLRPWPDVAMRGDDIGLDLRLGGLWLCRLAGFRGLESRPRRGLRGGLALFCLGRGADRLFCHFFPILSGMTPNNDPKPDTPLFSAVMTPNRSLGKRGFGVLMLLVAGISFVAGIVFAIAGAWPITGFFGLDVLLIYWAFRVNYRDGRAYEQIVVTPTELMFRKVSPRGAVIEWRCNPLWVKLDWDIHEEFGVQQLHLVSRGERRAIASFLSPEEKEGFGKALQAAIAAAKRGPDRTVIA